MAEHSQIAWTDHSFAPWFGCSKVSTGPLGACEHCYAENMTVNRFRQVDGFGAGIPRVRSAASTWKQPLAWNRKAERDGTRPFVFCSHLSDVFDNEVPTAWREDLFELIAATPNLIWLLLTKRPGNIVDLFDDAVGGLEDPTYLRRIWPRNAAIGFTAATQKEIDQASRQALAAYGVLQPAFLFWSGEPLMGAVIVPPELLALGDRFWAITGGETDQGKQRARPSHPDWERSIMAQCAAFGVPYFRKQMGGWAACEANEGEWPVDLDRYCRLRLDGTRGPDGWPMQHIGRNDRHALDGVIHDARPPIPSNQGTADNG